MRAYLSGPAVALAQRSPVAQAYATGMLGATHGPAVLVLIDTARPRARRASGEVLAPPPLVASPRYNPGDSIYSVRYVTASVSSCVSGPYFTNFPISRPSRASARLDRMRPLISSLHTYKVCYKERHIRSRLRIPLPPLQLSILGRK